MAYAAVISLKQTIHHLVNDSPDMKMLQSASKEINSLQQILQGLQTSINDNSVSTSRIRSSQGVINALNEKIREAACNLEDAVETQVSVQQEINYFKQGVKKMEDDYIEEINPNQDKLSNIKAEIKKSSEDVLKT